MNHHERESFIYRIRSGKVKIENDIYIIPPTIDQISDSYAIYHETYDQCVQDGIMTEDDMIVWMKENLIWTKYNENMVEKHKKEIEELKVEIFKSRDNPKKCNSIRPRIRHSEQLLNNHLILKNSEYNNTCEGIALSARLNWLVSQTTYNGSKKYNFDKILLQHIIYKWEQSFLSDTQIRELSRNEPWRSLWIIHKNITLSLFLNKPDQELTANQKNLIIWSQIYDNAHESLECPDDSVFHDDDMFDGWMILQHKNAEKQKLESKINSATSNSKIKNSNEVLIMAHDAEHAKNIYEYNSQEAKNLIQSRIDAINTNGTLLYQELPDVKQDLYLQQVNTKNR
jgi:hypothetical protein